jgi:hypothetical protein
MTSPVKFVKPAELFRMRRVRKHDYKFDITSQSPLKCLKDPSPIKKIPIVLKNPFRGRSVKRPLSFDSSNSPIKRPSSNNSSPKNSSPKKRPRINLEIDEDANMEAPYSNSNGLSTCDSDYDDDEDEENDEDASQFLESIGVSVSQQDFPSLEKFKLKSVSK